MRVRAFRVIVAGGLGWSFFARVKHCSQQSRCCCNDAELCIALAVFLTMNGRYASYDYDPYGVQPPAPPAHHDHQQQRHPGPCYEGYDPSAAAPPAPANLLGHAYTSTATASAYLPPPFMPGLDPTPFDPRVVQRHHQQAMPPSDKHLSITTTTPSMTFSLFDDPFEQHHIGSMMTHQADPAKPVNDDSWLDTLELQVSGVALEPLSGAEVLKRVRNKTDDVVTRYLPCVEFLVSCQQELRAGLAQATSKRLVRHAYRDNMTPAQFYTRYLAPLVERFHRRNKHIMEKEVLQKATLEIKKLCEDAQNAQYQGCEAMKNAFLGGMKDGESWGLRKWLSKNGGALHICNDLECILHACQKLDRNAETTRKLSERLRPLASQAMERLKNDVPASYQEVSTAHPYLPFFHRLDSALRGMANFDPEDDDVICIDDDDEIEEVKAKIVEKKPEKRSTHVLDHDDDYEEPALKRAKREDETDESEFGRDGTPPIKNPFCSDGEDDSVIEVFDVKPAGMASEDNSYTGNPSSSSNDHWRCSRCSMLNVVCSSRCCMCSKLREEEESCRGADSDNDDLDDVVNFASFGDLPSFEEAAATVAARIFDIPSPLQNTHPSQSVARMPNAHDAGTLQYRSSPIMSAGEMIEHLEQLAYLFDVNKQDMVRPATFQNESFWDTSEQYAQLLRLFVSLIRDRDSTIFHDPVNERSLTEMGRPYSDIIKHPLCFSDIVHSLVNLDKSQQKSDGTPQPSGSGILNVEGLRTWNMWRGSDLLQAIDLVFLNALAYHGKDKTKERSLINRLRKILWDTINRITGIKFGPDVEKRRDVTPTRRGETSGFVVKK